jgi:hypothetical protein
VTPRGLSVPARRTVARWLLAALVERGPQQGSPLLAAARLERPLSPHEARRLLAPLRWRPLPG